MAYKNWLVSAVGNIHTSPSSGEGGGSGDGSPGISVFPGHYQLDLVMEDKDINQKDKKNGIHKKKSHKKR